MEKFTPETIIREYYRPISSAALVTVLTGITILALIPIDESHGFDLSFWQLPIAADKVAHILAFLVIAGLIDGYCYQTGFGLKKVLITAGYGLGIECLQSLTDYRHPSFWDLVANCAGILMYWLLIPLFRVTPVLRVRWEYKNSQD